MARRCSSKEAEISSRFRPNSSRNAGSCLSSRPLSRQSSTCWRMRWIFVYMPSHVSLFLPNALSLPALNGIGILRPNQYIGYTRTYLFSSVGCLSRALQDLLHRLVCKWILRISSYFCLNENMIFPAQIIEMSEPSCYGRKAFKCFLPSSLPALQQFNQLLCVVPRYQID